MSKIKTTEEMRESFTDGGFWPSDDFDRWLEQHDAEVAAKAEQRIIKLLETKPDELMCCTCGIDELIALIKGENK